MAQRAIAWIESKNRFRVVRLYSNPSSLRPNETSRPVSIRKIPTPPIHLQCQLDKRPRQLTYPTRMCRGKYPINEPSLKAPRVKKTRPVSIELKANATMVVEMIAWSYESVYVQDGFFKLTSSPISDWIMLTRMWKNGTASIIIEPFPPGKILPPREKMSWETIHLASQ